MKYFLALFILFSTNAFSSSCCGGGSSSSMIITGDNRAELGLGYFYRSDIGQTNENGWSSLNSDQVKDQRQSIFLQGQYQVSESWQLASKFSLVDKNLNKSGLKEKNKGLGDIELQSTYEYLPEYTFSDYRPRGFGYFKTSIPTSKSLYNSQSNIFADVRGAGLFSVSLGNFLLKKLNTVTLKLTTEWTHYFGATYSQFKLHDFEKFVLPLGLAYTHPDTNFTFGITDTFSYQTEKRFTGELKPSSSQEYFWEVSPFVNYSPNRNEIWSLSYSDSTLIGNNINSPLYRAVSLNYTYVVAL